MCIPFIVVDILITGTWLQCWILLITLRPRQNGRHFPDDIFKWLFLNENVWTSIYISLKLVPRGPINNIPTLAQVMAWRRPGDKPLSEPMMVRLPTHICVTRPQWRLRNRDLVRGGTRCHLGIIHIDETTSLYDISRSLIACFYIRQQMTLRIYAYNIPDLWQWLVKYTRGKPIQSQGEKWSRWRLIGTWNFNWNPFYIHNK